jgi:hypothetical protein
MAVTNRERGERLEAAIRQHQAPLMPETVRALLEVRRVLGRFQERPSFEGHFGGPSQDANRAGHKSAATPRHLRRDAREWTSMRLHLASSSTRERSAAERLASCKRIGHANRNFSYEDFPSSAAVSIAADQPRPSTAR